DNLLKHPKKCPDGDEIPRRDPPLINLSNAPAGKPLRILFSKIEKQEELKRIKALGVIHGEKAKILKRVSGGPLILLIKGSEIALGKDVSSLIYVEVGA
ncbi:MAG: FeoA domain-containing protein, partial [Candidatus Micrarchaeota archaeon]